MQVIAAVIGREEADWLIRIAHDLVEIDHAVEGLAGADPFIHSLALALLGRWRGGKGHYGAPEDFEAVFVGAPELAQTGDDVVGGDVFRHGRRSAGMTDIVDAFQHNDESHARLRQDIALESRERAGSKRRAWSAGAIVQNAVAADADRKSTRLNSS